MSDLGFTNEGFAVRACRGHFHVTVGGCDLALPGDPFPTREAALDVALSEAVATVAALTAENAHLRETLTLGLGEQESVIAGLRAESERLDRAQRDHFTLREELRIACETGMRLNLPAGQIVARIRDSLGADAARFAIRDRESRAGLPSSRETTDG